MKYERLILGMLLVLLGAGIFLVDMPAVSASNTFSEKEVTKLQEVSLISVYDNYQVRAGLKTAWGFGSVIKTAEENLLFDTGGDAEVLLFNMKKMNIDPQSIDKVIISHIHGDHLGGLKGFLEKNAHVTVFIPSSFPDSVRKMITGKGAKVIDVAGPEKVSVFAVSTGELSGPPREQSLLISSKKGLIVMTGCGHPGIVHIVRKARELFPELKIHLAIGGFHHPPVAVVKGLRHLGVEKVAPSHCTGDHVIEAFKKEYKDDFIGYGVGKIIKIW